MLITFILCGKWLEAMARGKASEAMSTLLRLQPPRALVCDDPAETVWGDLSVPRPKGEADAAFEAEAEAEAEVEAEDTSPRGREVAVHEVEVSSLQRGDVVKVLPGSQVPARPYALARTHSPARLACTTLARMHSW